MKNLLTLAVLAGCKALPVPVPGEPPPVYTPRPIPTAIPEPTPTPEPVTAPTKVRVGQPFVVTYCGPERMENVSIRFDGKFDAGGLMGWAHGCKRQTIDGLNTAGARYFQFVVDGQPELQKYELIVEN